MAGKLSLEPVTAVGMLLRALARRDNPEFEYWRRQMNHDEREKERLFPLLYEVFRGAVELRFAIEGNPAQIKPFLEQPRLLLWPDHGFAVDKAEALMRSALGEPASVAGFETGDVVVIRMQILTYLVEDLELNDRDLNTLIIQSERWVAENGP
ncbi:hypothetical protein [Micromonospora sp. URMC 103]|uniref:hypothetical protein n=1 Tax=Micromonospora sp. URMC 103 TaxID=3423406 RepID=UPI003F1D33DC